MQRDIILTRDGSHSIAVPDMNVTYHSIHGAIQESLHVFIEAGLKHTRLPGNDQSLHILEMGFGTGLNALLTLAAAEALDQPVHYTTLELFPLEAAHVQSLNYCEQLNRSDLQPLFETMHSCAWREPVPVTPLFTLQKQQTDLVSITGEPTIHLIYFDAFAPGAQPELWTKEVFENLYRMLLPGGIFVTYCSKGDVRRALQAAGFMVEKIPGPPGKREMLRAAKP